jgi:hypothetical protein
MARSLAQCWIHEVDLPVAGGVICGERWILRQAWI